MPYEFRDIVKTLPEFGEHDHLIIEVVSPGVYRTIAVHNHRRYTIAEDQIADKVDHVDEKFPLLFEEEYDPETGFVHAKKKAQENPEYRDRWLFLSKLNPGDQIRVIRGKTLYTANFVGINIKKPKYAFRVTIQGRNVDLGLDSLPLSLQPQKNGVE